MAGGRGAEAGGRVHACPVFGCLWPPRPFLARASAPCLCPAVAYPAAARARDHRLPAPPQDTRVRALPLARGRISCHGGLRVTTAASPNPHSCPCLVGGLRVTAAAQIRAFRVIRIFRRMAALKEIVSAITVAIAPVTTPPHPPRRPPPPPAGPPSPPHPLPPSPNSSSTHSGGGWRRWSVCAGIGCLSKPVYPLFTPVYPCLPLFSTVLAAPSRPVSTLAHPCCLRI